jgi:acetylornithine deacetylase/succinyl-diaminopimelate desuccinylase-like protein
MRDEIIDLTSRLVAIDSVNPSLIAGGAGEGKIADLGPRVGA